MSAPIHGRVNLALDLERLPDVPPAAVVPLFAALLLLWLLVRVALLRGRLARRLPEDDAPRAPRWMLALAQRPAFGTALVLAFSAAVAACVWAYLHA